MPDPNDPIPATGKQEEKLIEASLEEIRPALSYPAPQSYPAVDPSKRLFQLQYLLGGGLVLLAVAVGVLLYLLAGIQGQSVTPRPVSTRVNGYDITFAKLEDPAELTGVISKRDVSDSDFFVLTLNNRVNCVPDAFATFPHNMISLLDKKGGATLIKQVEGIQNTTRTVTKMNVCGRDNGIVFVRTIVPVDRKNHFSGLSLSGLLDTGPLKITWVLQ